MTTSSYTPSQVQRSSSSGVGPDAGLAASMASCSHDLDVTKRDRFELLSAYLDGEVTPEERQQVLCWLQNDADTRCLYNRLLILRQGMRSQVCPPVCHADSTLVGVFSSLNRRLRLVTMASAGVAAIGVIQLLSGDPGMGPTWRGAVAVSQPEALHIALDRPAFPIPEAAVLPVEATQQGNQNGLPIESEL